MTEPIRLAKRLAQLLACSRREAELYIAGGWVTVDGEVVETPQLMVTQQTVALLPEAQLQPLAPVTLLLNYLPQTQIHAHNRDLEMHSSIRPLNYHLLNLNVVLPLDPQATGLAVWTQNWTISRKLTEESATIEQEYVAEVTGELSAEGLKYLNHGLQFKGQALPPGKVSWQNETRLRFALKGVQAGQIQALCQQVGLNMVSLKRLRIGRVSMGKIAQAHWRYLQAYERF